MLPVGNDLRIGFDRIIRFALIGQSLHPDLSCCFAMESSLRIKIDVVIIGLEYRIDEFLFILHLRKQYFRDLLELALVLLTGAVVDTLGDPGYGLAHAVVF